MAHISEPDWYIYWLILSADISQSQMCQYTSLIIAGIIVKKCAYIGQYSVKIEVLYFLILALVPTQNMAYSSGLLLRFFDQQIQTNPVEMKWNVPFLFNTPMFYHPLTVRQYSQVFLVTLDWSIQHYVTQWYPCSHGLDLSKSEKKTAITRLSPRRLRDLRNWSWNRERVRQHEHKGS